MFYTNHVSLAGNLITAPELRSLPSGTPVANARFAVVDIFMVNQGNEVAEKTSTFNLVFYGDLAPKAATLDANTNIVIEGRIETRSTSPTANRSITEIVVRRCARVTEI